MTSTQVHIRKQTCWCWRTVLASGSHPEANVLALADKELHQGVDSHPVDSHPEVNVLALVV